MRTVLGLLPVGILVVCLADAGAQQPTVRPVASILQLHEAIITPASTTVFNVGREAPKSEEEWAEVRRCALMLAESGNLLMIGSRARDQGDWMKMSRALLDAAAVALNAVEAKNVDAVVEAGSPIVVACESCHQAYRDGPKMGVVK